MALDRDHENYARQRIVELMKEIIEEEGLPFEEPTVDEPVSAGAGGRPKYPDIVIWEKGRRRAALVIELKRPPYDPLNAEVMEDASVKASMIGARYFATSNMQNLVLFDRHKEGPILDTAIGTYTICRAIARPRDIDRAEVRAEMRSGLKAFLLDFAKIYAGKEVRSAIPVGELLIYKMRFFVDSLSPLFADALIEKFERDADFRRRLQGWFAEQGWRPPLSGERYDDFYRAARQYLYLMANKLVFYYALKKHYPDLPSIDVEDVESGEGLRRRLAARFGDAVRYSGDYETIFGMDFIEQFPIPDGAVEHFKRFVEDLSQFEFEKLDFPDLGKIFDKLIPPEERHKLGQYFTSQRHSDGTYWPDVVDLILGFTVRSPDAVVLDGAVGAGTFLVRAYARLKYLEPKLSHKDILARLFGVDIAKFPALLAAINLAIRDLSVKENYPIVVVRDFFDVEPSGAIEAWANIQRRLHLLTQKERAVPIPLVDAFVGNPPYTRQEEVEDYIPGYKDKLAKRVRDDWGFEVGKRASLYVYFIIHGMKFLKEGGRLGYVTSNSWLDVDYGKYLQQFLLQHAKIVAVIESKAERWFEDADINAAILIAEMCSDEGARKNNLVKFVQLKKRLEEILPTTSEEERWKAVDKLVQLIEDTNTYYEDDALRIYPKRQGELWEEGYDGEQYVGSKWGKYLRAPAIFYKVMEKGRGLFIPLKEIARIERGFTTGANEFFYLTMEDAEKLGIEREYWMHPLPKEEPAPKSAWKDEGGEYFKRSQYAGRMRLEEVLRDDGYVYWAPNYVVKSPRELKGLVVEPESLKHVVLLIHRDKKDLGPNARKYVELGESRGLHRRPTCASRRRWYELEEIPGDLLCTMIINDRHAFWYNKGSLFDNTLYGISLKERRYVKAVGALLNSTLTILFMELWGRLTLGQGALALKVYEYEQIPIVDPRRLEGGVLSRLEEAFERLSQREIGSVFEEIGAEEPKDVSLDRVKHDRRELDKIVMGEILGLTEEEQLEVYRAVVDLVRSRLERAKSVKKGKKKAAEAEIEELVDSVIKELGLEPLPDYPDAYLAGAPIAGYREIPTGRDVEVENTLAGIRLVVDGEKVECSSLEEAKYLKWAALVGKARVPMPRDANKMAEIAKAFEREYLKRVEALERWLNENIPNRKEREAIKYRVLEKLLRG